MALPESPESRTAGQRAFEIPLDLFAERFFMLHGRPLSLSNRDYLRMIYRVISNPSIGKVVLKFSRQAEKCVTPDTAVTTEIGLPVPIRKIIHGTALVSPPLDGESVPGASARYVLHHNGIGRVHELTLESGKTIACTAAHLFWVRESMEHPPGWFPASMTMGMLAAEPLRNGRFLDARVSYSTMNPYLFGVAEDCAMDFLARKGYPGPMDFESDKLAEMAHALADKLGVECVRSGRSLVPSGPIHNSPTLRWSRVTGIRKLGYSELLDIEMMGTAPAYVASGVAVHNSTTLAAALLGLCAGRPHTRGLVVNPTDQNLQMFSRERLGQFMDSPAFRELAVDGAEESAVMRKVLNNGSQIFLRAAYRHADRTRGISSDILVLDEMQNIIKENIPVAEETQSHSEMKKKLYCGTPLTFDNPLETEWNRSKQIEYIIRCDACRHINILGERNIGLTGLICDKPRCGKPLSPSAGTWARLNPEGKAYGFRFPVIAAPWVNWGEILEKMENYSKQRFYNEVLALSCDIGLVAIQSSDIMRACDPNFREMWSRPPRKYANYDYFLGVDWGTREYGSTVMVVIMRERGKFRIVSARAYRGAESDPEYVVNNIIATFHAFRAQAIGVDWGGQYGQNMALAKALGDARIGEFQYSTIRGMSRYEPGLMRYLLNREMSLGLLFRKIAKGRFIFPAWDGKFQELARHFLNVLVEYSEHTRQARYVCKTGERDDFVHALNYAHGAAQVQVGDWKIE